MNDLNKNEKIMSIEKTLKERRSNHEFQFIVNVFSHINKIFNFL